VKKITILTIVALLTATAGCEWLKKITGKEKEEEFQYPEATLTHMGFDFSEGETGSAETWETMDGETINWQPGGETHPQYPNWEGYIWWRNDCVKGGQQTKDMGKVDISSVSSVPAEWDVSPRIPPLLVGHTVVAKCRDGYVKFQVLSTTATEEDWLAQVKYYYSASSTFEH